MVRNTPRVYNGVYRGNNLDHVAFPLGGIGAGMICLEGTGALSHVSLRHKPDVFHKPLMFAALHVKGAPIARLLEGPVPMRMAFGLPLTGNGHCPGQADGLPRFAQAEFVPRFPFGIVRLADKTMPVQVELTGWSPFVPGDADNSSLPVAGLEYRICNRTGRPLEAVFSFHAANFMKSGPSGSSIKTMDGGFIVSQSAPSSQVNPENDPAVEGYFTVFTTESAARVDGAWFRGGHFDSLTMLWNAIAAGKAIARGPHQKGDPGGGASLYVPFKLKPGAEKTIRIMLAWYVPRSNLLVGTDAAAAPQGGCAGNCACGANKSSAPATYIPWYAACFKTLKEAADYWRTNYNRLRAQSKKFSDCFYDTNLPPETVEAMAANLTILKSPTCLRDTTGRLWGWEGCGDSVGCCYGSCTHVWNYAQAIPHLFPDLERSLRETEFQISQNDCGHQMFRASLPIRPPDHASHAAADGQLGGLVKLYREWRIGGDNSWMQALWPKARQSLDYCIATWDPRHTGTLVEPHHNTYDIEFWGADAMCTSFYLGALQAAVAMGETCGDDMRLYQTLLAKGKRAMESTLWNREYFIQKIQWQGLQASKLNGAKSPLALYTPEALAILKKEGPKYQYGTGCLSDGVLGDWLARVSGLNPVLDQVKVARHLAAVFKYNYRSDFADHANPQRPGYALGREGGLLLCSWPKGGKPSLPFIYSDEVWTGIEYQVASHLIMMGRVVEGLQIVRTVRDRYDGSFRNPFNEYECGHWYARAMSSYGLLTALSGARYDAVDKILYLHPRVKGDFRAFLAAATGFGTVGIRKGKPFLDVKHGAIPVSRIEYTP